MPEVESRVNSVTNNGVHELKQFLLFHGREKGFQCICRLSPIKNGSWLQCLRTCIEVACEILGSDCDI